jgi:hypothetical protein
MHREALASVSTLPTGAEANYGPTVLRLAGRLVERGAFADVFTIGAFALAPFVPFVLWLGGRPAPAPIAPADAKVS